MCEGLKERINGIAKAFMHFRITVLHKRENGNDKQLTHINRKIKHLIIYAFTHFSIQKFRNYIKKKIFKNKRLTCIKLKIKYLCIYAF